MSGLGSFISSFFPTTHADSDDSKSDDSSKDESAPEVGDDAEAKDDGEGEGGAAEEEEEEEPEDAAPGIRDACAARAECAPMKHHFEKCQEKIEAGKGFKGEECVEELLRFALILVTGGLPLIRAPASCTAPKPAPRRRYLPSSVRLFLQLLILNTSGGLELEPELGWRLLLRSGRL
ncbi:hypothetical protein C8F04DRAFT_1323174 [Mycena alexandri]|uniref:Ubiquinol-cytochrome C reductase hinge domain-containing protein n=1 Tax=Mycena alexandri TaxID=1745969 RepID=A0AAD6XFH2_9AGAR|nr:hypothetical protein C8F04DRAFT_1323174 [Mycena alexandri]